MLLFGRIFTNIGDSFYTVAAMWLVYELGGSTFYTGLAGFLSILPRIIQFLSGPMIDRIPLRKLLVFTQVAQGVLVTLIPIMAYFNILTITVVLIVAPLLTTFNVFVYPAQLAALPRIIPKNQLMKGNSLFSLSYQGVDIAFNALAGILISLIGVYTLYIIDAFTFAFAAIFFMQLSMGVENRIKPSEKQKFIVSFKSYWEELKEGSAILFNTFFSRLLAGAIIINLVGGATFVVLPAFASEQGGAHWYGFLLAAQAIGVFVGVSIAPYLNMEKYRLGMIYIVAFFISGILWTTSIFMPSMLATVIIYGLAWVPGGVVNILIFTVIQRLIPKNMLGRVFSAVTSISGLAMPLGSLGGGILGTYFGSSTVILLSGLSVTIVSIIWLIDPIVRSIPSTASMDENTFTVVAK